jgi:hypothetical protein
MRTEMDVLKSRLWEKSLNPTNSEGLNLSYWNNISISLTGIEYCVSEFLKNNNPRISVCFAKILIMEIWNIREFLRALNINISEFDDSFPNIKRLRDSYAHIDERINGTKKEFKKPSINLNLEKRSIANGAIISIDGSNWQTTTLMKRQFNMHFKGSDGMMSIFGIVNDYLICNSENELIEFEINHNVTETIMKLIDKACT